MLNQKVKTKDFCGCMHESFCGLKYYSSWKDQCPCFNCLVKGICLNLCTDRYKISEEFNNKQKGEKS